MCCITAPAVLQLLLLRSRKLRACRSGRATGQALCAALQAPTYFSAQAGPAILLTKQP